MVDPIAVGMVAAGIVLLFSGAALSVYGAGLLGAVLGGGGGYLIAPTIAGAAGVEGPAGTAVAVAVGAVVGVGITYVLLSMAIAAMGFLVGTYLGVVAVNPVVGGDSLLVTVGVGVGTGIALAFLGMLLTRTTMVIITSFIGAALASQSITVDAITDAADEFPNMDPIVFDVGEPLFVGLFALGILSQFGLFKLGYVRKIAGLLPGASVLRDGESAES
ncbi:phosphate ABC transporter permease [Halovenus rubra]|uniref:Phosphate ABC transporter permease n=2 Tax=Halovenus rubra TaxID=869890 RepID=A0ABD5X5U6_9EURY|nr:hypothetical protein [Halovenus rubra]